MTNAPSQMDQVLAAANAARPAGSVRRIGSGAARPLDALWRTAQELYALLTDLNAEEWAQPTKTEYGDVRDVVAHLIGIERYSAYAVTHRDDADPAMEHRHTEIGRADIERFRSRPSSRAGDVADEWFDAVAETVAAFQSDDDGRPIQVHGLRASVDLALVFRTFELWAHTEDICAAVRRPLPRLDGPRMGLLASTLVGVLPLFFSEPNPEFTGHRARIVLLGPGGGVVDLDLDPSVSPTTPSVRMVADVVDFCRVAARRLPVDELALTATGELALLTPVLVAAAAFAMD